MQKEQKTYAQCIFPTSLTVHRQLNAVGERTGNSRPCLDFLTFCNLVAVYPVTKATVCVKSDRKDGRL